MVGGGRGRVAGSGVQASNEAARQAAKEEADRFLVELGRECAVQCKLLWLNVL